MADMLEMKEEPLVLSKGEIKSLNGRVLKMGDVGEYFADLNKVMNAMVGTDWLEAFMDAFGLRIDKAIETFIRAQLGSSGAARVLAKALLSVKSGLIGVILAVARAIWKKVAAELMQESVNAVFDNAWTALQTLKLPHPGED